jgi:hypothetical protein
VLAVGNQQKHWNILPPRLRIAELAKELTSLKDAACRSFFLSLIFILEDGSDMFLRKSVNFHWDYTVVHL